MLSMEYVESLIKKHQGKAVVHIEQLKAKIKASEVNDWVFDEEIAQYWSHSEVLYLPLNSLEFINYYLKTVLAAGLIRDLDKIANTDYKNLETLYFKRISESWSRQGITRPAIPEDCASEDFLGRIFKL